MDEQAFLTAIENSMQESARQLQAMGRPTSHATREEAMRQVAMLQEARGAWKYKRKK